MVVFTCNHCGDSLQKPRVEKHYNFVCRTTKSLTCIDCLKDFRGEEYVNHTKCLTEEERYSAKGAYANGIVKKGEVKQESWIEMIKSIIEKETNLKPSIKNLLNTISNYSNVPRKKPKFLNFIKSSSGGRANMKEVEEVWDIIEKYKADQVKVKEQNSEKSQEKNVKRENLEKLTNTDVIEAENSKKDLKKKKSKIEETEGSENVEKSSNSTELHEEHSKKKRKQSAKNQTSTEEKMDSNTEQEHIKSTENEVKNDKKNKKAKKDKSENIENGDSKYTNGVTENVDDVSNIIQNNGLKKKSKKKKLQEAENEEVSNSKKLKLDTNVENSTETVQTLEEMDIHGHFDFKQKILEVVTSKGSYSVKKLEKKVINAYLKHFGLSEISPKIVKKFNKKFKKIENIVIVNDNVTLKA